METCNLYNRLGKLIKKRSEIEQSLKSIIRSEDQMKLKNQLSDIVTAIKNINREIDAKEKR